MPSHGKRRKITAATESWPISGTFNISRGSKTEAEVILLTIEEDNGIVGRAECVPYSRYGETVSSVREQIESARRLIEVGTDQAKIVSMLDAGAARNAIDCAFWDLDAKRGSSIQSRICANPPRPIMTAMTISLAEPEEMARQARAHASRPLLKVKLGGGDSDADRIHAVASAAPGSAIILDANEAWRPDNIGRLMLEASKVGIRLIEQPLPVGEDGMLEHMPHPVPICADESAHTRSDLESLRGRYDCVNIKLDKTGGLTEAIAMRDAAHALGFSVMVGCMVATSLSMAPAVLLAQEVEFVDLDGPLILSGDRPYGLQYSGSLVSPPSSQLWG